MQSGRDNLHFLFVIMSKAWQSGNSLLSLRGAQRRGNLAEGGLSSERHSLRPSPPHQILTSSVCGVLLRMTVVGRFSRRPSGGVLLRMTLPPLSFPTCSGISYTGFSPEFIPYLIRGRYEKENLFLTPEGPPPQRDGNSMPCYQFWEEWRLRLQMCPNPKITNIVNLFDVSWFYSSSSHSVIFNSVFP